MRHTRRDFLKAAIGTSALATLGLTESGMFVEPAIAGMGGNNKGTVLVAIQLTGGNDGLNTVVPYEDDEYGRNRTTLRLPTNELHKIDSSLGFHPRMSAFKKLYEDGYLSIVQGVGSVNPDRSHEGAMMVWHTAEPEKPNFQTGWLGRVADCAWKTNKTDTTATFVGPINQPFALNAENAIVPSIGSAGELVMQQANKSTNVSGDGSLLDFLRQSTNKAAEKSSRIEKVINPTGKGADYPSCQLARDLCTVGQLIRADIGIRVFLVELGGGGIGGFDNHANQLGNHCALLEQLAESVGAFVYDMKRDGLLDRVLLMTYSEFGRTLKENGRRGTGHGAGAPVFFAGGGLKGGVVGTHPSLTDLDNGALKFHTDFRQVYATVLDRWLGFDSKAVLGGHFETLDILKS